MGLRTISNGNTFRFCLSPQARSLPPVSILCPRLSSAVRGFSSFSRREVCRWISSLDPRLAQFKGEDRSWKHKGRHRITPTRRSSARLVSLNRPESFENEKAGCRQESGSLGGLHWLR